MKHVIADLGKVHDVPSWKMIHYFDSDFNWEEAVSEDLQMEYYKVLENKRASLKFYDCTHMFIIEINCVFVLGYNTTVDLFVQLV